MAAMCTMPECCRVELRLRSHNVSWPSSVTSITANLCRIDRCRCGHQFCYLCGVRWKDCTCELFNEDRLLERAGQIADRPQPRGAPAVLEADRNERVQAIAQELRDRHDCEHEGRWRRIDGRSRCEECGHWLRDFILECRHCMLRACVRCRRNRL